MAGIASSSLPIPRGAPCPREVGVGTRFGRRDPRASAAAPVALRARRPRRPARLMPLRPERAGDGVVSDPGLGSWPRSQSPESVHREGPSAQVLVGGLRFGWGPRTNHWARRTSKAAVSMKDPGNPPLPTGWPLFRIRLRSSPPPAWVVSRVGISVCPCPPGVPTQGGNGSLWKSAPEVLGRPQGPGGLVVFAEGVLG